MIVSKNFVGRNKELKLAFRILSSGRSLIVEGSLGIGKTTFAKKAAMEFSELPLYCSFEGSALSIVETLNRQIIKSYRPNNARLGTQVQEFLRATEGKRPLVIIDNIWKVTLQKVRFLKRINENQNCQFIFISEVRDRNKLLLIKSVAWNNETITLGRLSKEESILLFEKSLSCMPPLEARGNLKALIESCRGYPLGIIETAKLC